MKKLAAIVLLFNCLAFSGVSFIQQPRLVKGSTGAWTAEFELSDGTDITVAVLNLRDGSIVRHLAAGVLGGNAPSPLTPSSLAQRISWDGRDDLGRVVTADSLGLRVRAGMSVKLINLIGGNPYHFNAASGINSGSGYATNISGMVQDGAGNMFVCGSPGPVYHHHTFKNYKVIRKYGPDGKFIKTVFPFRANLSREKAVGWGINIFNSGYAPVQAITSFPGFTNTILGLEKDPEGSLLMIDSSGVLTYGSADIIMTLDTLGGALNGGATAPLIATPARKSILGATFFTPLPNRREALLSGFFYAVQANGHLSSAPRDSFYSDGKVFKVNLATGATTPWLALDSAPILPDERLLKLGGGEYIASVHGTAVDKQGRVYVADRLHKRVGVYDTNGVPLGGFPVACADNIAVSARSGAVYVATRYQKDKSTSVGSVRLFKFTGWPDFQPVCSLTVENSVMYGNAVEPVYLSVNEATPETRLWFTYNLSSVKIFRDDADRLTKIIDFEDSTAKILHGYDRLAVDHRTGTLYINDSWMSIFKIEDWANPLAVPCTTSLRQRLYGRDMQVGANNLLYVSSGNGYTGPITRYTLDHLHAPANWPNTGKNMLVSSTPGHATGDRGLAVRNDGRVAVMGVYGITGGVKLYADSGANDTNSGKVMLYPMPSRSGCVRYDLQGNLYVGARTAGVPVPPEFANDWAFKSSVGAVVKYDRNTETGSITDLAAINAAKVYPYPLSPYSTDRGMANCICRNPRFDVDRYGRLFIPSSALNQVIVSDNAGNEILRFGQYGNPDSWGGLPQAWPTVLTPDVPLAFPTAVAAGEDHIFVSDVANCRLARLKINYALDNLPGMTAHQEGRSIAAPRQTALTSSPVPFTSAARISVSLPSSEDISLRVFGLDGRLVKTLADGSLAVGTHGFVWNGTDEKGNRLASGVYFYRLMTRSGAFVTRTFLNR